MGYEAQWDPSAQIILCLKEAIYLLPDDRGGWRLGAGHHTLPARCCELLFNVHVDSLFHLLARTPRGVGKHIGVGADAASSDRKNGLAPDDRRSLANHRWPPCHPVRLHGTGKGSSASAAAFKASTARTAEAKNHPE